MKNMNNLIPFAAMDFLPVNPAQWSPWLTIIGISISIFLMSSIICKKTGIHKSNSTICLIPLLGPFIFLWILAFTKWPIHVKLPDSEKESSNEEVEQSLSDTTTTTTKRRIKKRKKR